MQDEHLRFDLLDQWLFLFFNNLEEVVKIYQLERMRLR